MFRRRSIGLTLGFTAITLGAVLLAAVAPLLVVSRPSTNLVGWHTIYDGLPHDDGTWVSQSAACEFVAIGLDIRGIASHGNGCVFEPSQNIDITSNGFTITLTLAPAGDVQGYEMAGLLFTSDTEMLDITVAQDGTYEFCAANWSLCLPGSTAEWHEDPYLGNVVTVGYDPNRGTVTLYVNGQTVSSRNVDLGLHATIGLYTEANDEVILTHVVITSAN